MICHYNRFFSSGCPVRVRKNIKNLSELEVADLNQALKAIKENGQYDDQVASYHGAPRQCCTHYHEIFKNELFLFWHTAHMEQMEDLLGAHLLSPTLGLPFWDWTEAWNSSTPLIRDIATKDELNPWSYAFNPQTNRDTARYITGASDLYTTNFSAKVQNNLCETDFMKYSRNIEQIHGEIHGYTGASGDMGTIKWAGYDPIFYLHHSQVEKVFTEYQMCQEEYYSSNFTEYLYSVEKRGQKLIDSPLACFENPNINKNSRTARQNVENILNNRNQRCYEYENITCSRKCVDTPYKPIERYIVCNMVPVETSGKFSFDVCIPSEACDGGCCYLTRLYISFFGFGSNVTDMKARKTIQNTENYWNPYNLDITEYLEGYEGFNANLTWLATVPCQIRNLTFTDYSPEGNDLPLDVIDTNVYNLVVNHTDEGNTYLISGISGNDDTIVSEGKAKIQFVDTYGNSPISVWYKPYNESCDSTQFIAVPNPVTVTTTGYHYFYNQPTAPTCKEKPRCTCQGNVFTPLNMYNSCQRASN